MKTRAAVPFHIRRSEDEFTGSSVTSTTERVHGLVRLDESGVVFQWRVSRETASMGGASYRTDNELEAVREMVVPLSAVSGASVRRRWWHWLMGPSLTVFASDLRAFEEVTGMGGLKLAHPAEISVRIRRADLLLAEEFASELALALAERALAPAPEPEHPKLPPTPSDGAGEA